MRQSGEENSRHGLHVWLVLCLILALTFLHDQVPKLVIQTYTDRSLTNKKMVKFRITGYFFLISHTNQLKLLCQKNDLIFTSKKTESDPIAPISQG